MSGLLIRAIGFRHMLQKRGIPAQVFKIRTFLPFPAEIRNLWAGKCTQMDAFGRQNSARIDHVVLYSFPACRTPLYADFFWANF